MKVFRYIIVALQLLCVVPTCFSFTGQEPTDAEVIKYDKRVEVDGNKLNVLVSTAIQINNAEGHFMTNISIPFSASNKIKDLEASIKDSQGNEVKKLKRKDVSDVSSISGFSLYEDNFNRTFELSHNRYPYVLEYSYSIAYEGFMTVEQWTPVISLNSNTQKASLTLVVPKNFEISIKEQNIDQAVKTELGEHFEYKWYGSFAAEDYKREVYSPPVQSVIPMVSIIPINFDYGIKGSFKSWQTYGQWLERLSTGLHDLPDNEKLAVRQLVKGIPDTKSKVKALYHYLQDNVRYINVSIGIGGMLPYPASYVAENKYGDCKALTNYMQAVLGEVGIEAYCVDIYADDIPLETAEDFPSQQFNHVILAVPDDGDTLWVEATSNTSPFNYLGTFTQNRKALFVNGEKSKIIQVPGLTETDVQRETKIQLSIEGKGQIRANIDATYKGDDFETLQYYLKNESTSELQTYAKSKLPFRQVNYQNIEVAQANRDMPQINIQAEADLSEYGRVFGATKVLPLPPIDFPTLTRPSLRKTPLFIPFPVSFKDEIEVSVSGPVEADLANGNDSIRSSFGYFSIETIKENNRIKILRTFTVYPGKYDLQEYELFYQFIADIDNSRAKTHITIK